MTETKLYSEAFYAICLQLGLYSFIRNYY